MTALSRKRVAIESSFPQVTEFPLSVNSFESGKTFRHTVPSICIFSCVIYTFFYDFLSGYFHVLLKLARQLLMFEFDNFMKEFLITILVLKVTIIAVLRHQDGLDGLPCDHKTGFCCF